MTDRELLEQAAKAAGVEGEYVCWCLNGFKEGIREPSDTTSIPWNPLTDDGDALRLAVKLRLSVHVDENMTDVEDCTETHLSDPYAATRRAIVRAAAGIGRGMP